MKIYLLLGFVIAFLALVINWGWKGFGYGLIMGSQAFLLSLIPLTIMYWRIEYCNEG